MSAVQQLKTRSRSIVFVTSQLRQREIKMAYALRALGWIVNLIYYNSTPFRPEGYFDFVKEVKSAHEAHAYAQQLAPGIIHVFSGAIDDYILLFCREKLAPVVIDLNDVFNSALMNYCPERFNPTREALALADGYCARDLQVKYAERLDGCQLPEKIIFFPEFCWHDRERLLLPKLSQDEVHIVSVGTISLETHGMFDCCYLELAQRLLQHKIHFHMYPPWCYRKDHASPNVNFARDYAPFLELARDNPYLHIHDSLPAEKLIAELDQYDFGIISGGCQEFGQKYGHFKPAYVESCYSGRIADYLDACLPVLINEEVAFNYWLLKRYGVGIDLKGVLQPGFKAKLQALKANVVLQKQVQAVGKKFSIASHAFRLAMFYSKLIDTSTIIQPKRKQHLILAKLRQIIPEKISKARKFFA